MQTSQPRRWASKLNPLRREPVTAEQQGDLRPRRGWSQQLGDGFRREHTVSCTTINGTSGEAACECPVSFWHPGRKPRRRVRVAGGVEEAVRLRERLRHRGKRAAYERKALDDLLGRTPVVAAAPTTADSPTMAEWVKRLFDHQWKMYAPATREQYARTWRKRLEPHFRDVWVEDVSPEQIEDWLGKLIAAEGRIQSVEAAYHLMFNILAVWHKRRGTPNPAKMITRPHDPERPTKRARDRTLTFEQYTALQAACDTPSDVLMIRTATEGGLRRGELTGLQHGDVDIKRGTICVQRQGHSATTKSKRSRIVTINPSLAALFAQVAADAVAEPGHYVWPSRYSPAEPCHFVTVADRIRAALTRAGLVDPDGNTITSPHGLRATGATLAAQAGVPGAVIQHQLGHKSIAMTENHYLGRPDDAAQAAYGNTFNTPPVAADDDLAA